MEADDTILDLAGSGNGNVPEMKLVVVSIQGMDTIMAEYLEGGEESDNYVKVRRPLIIYMSLEGEEPMPYIHYKKVINWADDDESANYRFEKPNLIMVKAARKSVVDFYKAAAKYMYDKQIQNAGDPIFEITARNVEKAYEDLIGMLNQPKVSEEDVKANIAANTSIN